MSEHSQDKTSKHEQRLRRTYRRDIHRQDDYYREREEPGSHHDRSSQERLSWIAIFAQRLDGEEESENDAKCEHSSSHDGFKLTVGERV